MAAWDEDDHLLDEMLDGGDNEVDGFGDGWDEDLTGLSSDEEAAPAAGNTVEEATDSTAANGADPETITVVQAATAHPNKLLAADSTSELGEATDENNAWDFDDFEDSSSAEAKPQPSDEAAATTAAVGTPNPISVLPDTYEAPVAVNNLVQQKEVEQQVHLQSVVSDESNNNQISQNDEWDFEDDLFSEKSDAGEVKEAQVANVVRRSPPPPAQPTNTFLASQPAAQKSNPLIDESVLQIQNGNPFLAKGTDNIAPIPTAPTNQTNSKDTTGDIGDNEGWSDDEAFFDDDAMESLPAVPASRLNKSPMPLPPPPPQMYQTNLSQQQQPLTDPTQIKIHNLLSRYLTNISSPQFLPRLHSKIIHSSNLHTQGTNLRDYYATRPGLRQYTLGVEMDRMDYMLVTHDGRRVDNKDEIRQYFGGYPESQEEEPTVDEVLIRSANQSLLADALVLLTGLEDVLLVDDFLNNQEMSLILSGPLLCMTSVAETCRFVVDLMNGVVEATCYLAVGIPFHGEGGGDERIVKDGMLILARARVLVRFRPGSLEMGEESTVQYVVESVESSFQDPEVPLLRDAAISLARDQLDPFFQQEEIQEDVTDVRDLFLLNHHLLSDSHLIAVSDHLVRLKGAAEASSTGFRSALRQLDGVTGVSGKINMIKNATGTGGSGGGIGGFFSLPSAEEIEAAEREAVGSFHASSGGHFPRPNKISKPAADHFPRPVEISNHYGQPMLYGQGRPPPPPPPPPPQTTQQGDASRPRPLIGGMFLSGLSRLAAAATQPSDPHHHSSYHSSQPNNQAPRFHQTDAHANPSYQVPQWDGATGGTGLTPSVVDTSRNESTSFASPVQPRHPHDAKEAAPPIEEKVAEDIDEMDGGWSDDGLDFEDEEQQEETITQPIVSKAEIAENHPIDATAHVVNNYMVPHQPIPAMKKTVEADLKFPNATEDIPRLHHTTAEKHYVVEPTATFEDEFVLILKEKIEEEEKEMKESGRMRRWRPLSEDPIRRERLMEIMVNQLDRS
jgi:hypothetical protein